VLPPALQLNAPPQAGTKRKRLQRREHSDQLLKGSSTNSITGCLQLATTQERAASSSFKNCEGFSEILPSLCCEEQGHVARTPHVDAWCSGDAAPALHPGRWTVIFWSIALFTPTGTWWCLLFASPSLRPRDSNTINLGGDGEINTDPASLWMIHWARSCRPGLRTGEQPAPAQGPEWGRD